MPAPTTAQLLDGLKQAFAARDRARINATVAALVAARAPIGGNWRSLADVMIHNGELSLARAAIDQFVVATGNTPAAQFARVAVLARTGDAQAARVALDRLPADVPDRLGHAYMRGMLALNLGAVEEARAQFLRALDAAPRSGQTWFALAMTGRKGGSEAIATRILGAGTAMAGAPPAERAQYLYARGKVLADLGDHDAGFAATAQGAALVAAQSAYDPQLDTRSAEAALSGFDRDAIAGFRAGVTIATDRVVFVTGTPRSGTTLVEQILASHSAVAGGEELGRFPLLAEEIGGVAGADLQRWLGNGGSADALAGLYLHLVTERFGPSGRVVDKTLDASRHMGLIASILPQARIVWMRRDPLDRAWSCFRNYLLGVPWSYDLRQIAHHFRLEDRLLERWQDILGERLLVLDYEDVVADAPARIPVLLAHVGLDAEPQVFEPHKTERLVTTSSVTQVRRPINRDAIGAAVPYRRHLQPFIDAYGYSG